MVKATVEIYNSIRRELLPTPAKSHYTFNLRDLSKNFQGILMADVRSIDVRAVSRRAPARLVTHRVIFS